MERENSSKYDWHKEEVGNSGHFIDVRAIDPKIQAQMPVSGRTFLQVGPVEYFVGEVKKLLMGKPNDLLP
jgi:hypothetical protein